MDRELWACVALALVVSAAAVLVLWRISRLGRALDAISKHQRALRLQLGNLLSMLLRAGYKRGPTVDWSDDEHKTEVMGQSDRTRWDWKKPSD